MNSDLLSNFVKDLNDKLFTNVTIEFVDETESIRLDAHQDILAFSCDYFKKLFQFNKSTFYRIVVPDANCAVSIVKEFYNIISKEDDSVTILYYLECKNFFGLPIDFEMLYQLNVPTEGFREYLKIVEIIFFSFESLVNDRRMVRSIQRNVPNNYVGELPTSLVKEFNQKSYLIKKYNEINIQISDLYTNRILMTRSIPINDTIIEYYDPKLVCFSLNGQSPITIITNLITESIFHTINTSISIVTVSPNKKYIITSEQNEETKYLICYDLSTKKLIWCRPETQKIQQVIFTPNSEKIIYLTQPQYLYQQGIPRIITLNLFNGKFINEIPLGSRLNYNFNTKIGISPNGKILSATLQHVSQSTMHLWNIETLEIFASKIFASKILDLSRDITTFVIDSNISIYIYSYYFHHELNSRIIFFDTKTTKDLMHYSIPSHIIDTKILSDKNLLLFKTEKQSYSMEIDTKYKKLVEITDIEFIELSI